jgi:hypothetical protein
VLHDEDICLEHGRQVDDVERGALEDGFSNHVSVDVEIAAEESGEFVCVGGFKVGDEVNVLGGARDA